MEVDNITSRRCRILTGPVRKMTGERCLKNCIRDVKRKLPDGRVDGGEVRDVPGVGGPFKNTYRSDDE